MKRTIRAKEIDELSFTGADATACVKSARFNMTKTGYAVHVISYCFTSFDLKKINEMLTSYAEKACEIMTLAEE